MNDFNNITNQVSANYWANKAVTETDRGRTRDNRNTINQIGNSQKIIALEDENIQLEIEKNQAIIEKSQAIIEKSEIEIINLKLEEENNFYKNLLAKPMVEIAKNNSDFKAVYEQQQELLASWMVSQKAFKEVAVSLGIQLGKTKEEVLEMGSGEATKNVLYNNTCHNNNAIESSIITPHIERLKHKLIKK